MRKELIEKRKEREKHFLNKDGTIQAIIYDDDVHYLKDGKYIAIDNTLIDKNSKYENKSNKYQIKFEKYHYNKLLDIDNQVTIQLKGRNYHVADRYIYELLDEQINDNTITYYNVFNGIDISYELLPTKIKEYIVINNKESLRETFSFLLETNLSCVIDQNNYIKIGEDYVMEPSFMIDGNNELSYNIVYKLEKVKNGYELQITLDKNWLYSDERVFPIIVDPTITTRNSGSMQDTYISSKYPNQNFNNQEHLLAGVFDNGNEIGRSLLKFDLPVIGTGSSIIEANLHVTAHSTKTYEYPAYSNTVNLHALTEDFNEANATWNNMHNKYDSIIQDYQKYEPSYFNQNENVVTLYTNTFYITNLVKKWYDDLPNYGLMLKSNREVYISNQFNGKYFSKNHTVTTVDPKPFISITYRNQNGLENYMTYQERNITHGKLYFNNYNGNTVGSFSLGTTGSGRFPASLTLYYNTNDVILNNDYGFGLGMKLNYHQTMKEVTIENEIMYEYVDEDGTIHYFRKNLDDSNDDNYYDEDGLSLTLTININEAIMKDKDQNKMIFSKYNNQFRLIKIEDIETNQISIVYTDNQITKIVDQNNEEMNITYDTNQITITSFDTETTLVLNQNKLSSMMNDYGTTTLLYNGQNIISEITDVTGEKIKLYYYNVLPYRVMKIEEYGLNQLLGPSLDFTYDFGTTSVIDNLDRNVTYSFNKYGNTVSTTTLNLNEFSSKGYGKESMYNSVESIKKYKNKQLTEHIFSRHIHNYLYNSSFEYSNILFHSTNGLSISLSDEEKVTGLKSLKLNGIGNAQLNIALPLNQDYTFSFYSKASDDFKVKLISNITEEIEVKASATFERNEITISKEDVTSSFTILIELSQSNTVYIDDIQLEEGKFANYYNMMDNSNFYYGIGGWNISESYGENDDWVYVEHNYNLEDSLIPNNTMIQQDEIVTLQDGTKALKFVGDPEVGRTLTKKFLMDGNAGDYYHISFWYRNLGVEQEGEMGEKQNRLHIQPLVVDPNNASGAEISLPLNPHSQQWQFYETTVYMDYDYHTLNIHFFSHKCANYIYVTNFNVIKGISTLKTSVDYDDYGNLITNFNQDQTKFDFNYDKNNQLIKMIDPKGSNFSYEYDNDIQTRVLNGISTTGISNAIQYDQYGNPIVTKITSNIETDLDSGTYYIRNKGTKKYWKLNTITKKIECSENDCSHDKWIITKINDNITIKPMYNFMGLIGTVGSNNLKLTIEKQPNSSYTLKNNNDFVTISNYELTLHAEVDLSNQQFYFEKVDSKLFIENQTQYSNDGKYLIKTKDSLFNETNYDYDELTDLLMSNTDSKGNITEYTYDTQKRITSITKEDIEIEYNYNYLNLLESIIQDNKEYQFTYDDFLNVKTIKVGNQLLITNHYKPRNGNLESVEYGNNQEIIYEYDDFDRIVKVDKMNDTYNYYYDIFSKLRKIETDDIKIDYIYDIYERLVTYKENDFELGFEYNSFGEISKVISKLEEIEDSQELEYNTENALTQLLADDYEINYHYDELGRLESKQIGNYEINYSYVTHGNRTSTVVNKIEDEFNTFTYTYDEVGNITTIKQNNVVTNEYTYDVYNQLIKEQGIDNKIEYTYDLQGNMLNIKEYDENELLVNENLYEYNNINWPDQLTKYNNNNITYDAIGNPLTIGTDITLTWMNGRELASYEDNSKNLNVEYKYNQDGIRIQKKINNEIINYYLEGNKIIYRQTSQDLIYFMYDNSGVIGFRYNEDYYYYVKNLQQDIIGIIDEDKELIVKYQYDSWGNIISIKDENGDPITDPDHIGNINPFRYRSYQYDTETGLYYLNSRYYSPEWGRFVNADAGFDSANLIGNNLFQYGYNNPVNVADSEGNWPKWLTWENAKKVATTVAVVGVATLATVAIVASAPVIATAVAVTAASLGASGTAIAAAAVTAKVVAYGVAAATVIVGLNNAGEAATGKNIIRDKVLGGSQKAYDTLQTATAIAGSGIITVGATYALPKSSNINNQHKVPSTGEPFSQTTKLVKDGYQTRFYDFKGKASFDIHATEHAPGTHVNPHFHIWDSGKPGPWKP